MACVARTVVLLLCGIPGALLAQGASDSSAPTGDDFKILRQMIEQQSRQIDVLAQEVARLNLLLDARNSSASGLVPSPSQVPASEEPSIPKAVPVRATAPTPGTPAFPAGPVHVVAKGETLTAIAKRYKVTVPELLKVNKIADVRKLQIGQTLVLPPGAKITESPIPSPTQPQ